MLNKTTIAILIIISILSGIYILCSFYDFYQSNLHTAKTFYSALATYSGLYKVALAFLALYLTLNQIRIAQQNNVHTLAQMKTNQDQILKVSENERKENTLKHCSIYFTDIQQSIKELVDKQVFNGLPVYFSPLLSECNNESLAKNVSLYKKISDNISLDHKEIVLFLNKIDAFALYFLYGNIDLEMGGSVIGSQFLVQSEMWMGFIAYYRQSNDSIFCINILKLRDKWKTYKDATP